ncbi:amidohydrolase family protein [Aquisediminimonas profunda]|uniref:amidohydrolase family protein n=1 Tax=Aquisediminimonas profunda TaxID=1550733 RepID=UPI001C63A0FA|nr:amidohydrolase family protein [Aquisediminimonas profunda]
MSGKRLDCGSGHETSDLSKDGRHKVVDIHCHLNVQGAQAYVQANVAVMPNPAGFSSPQSDAVMAKLFAQLSAKLNNIDLRIPEMDSLGIDIQAISPSPGQYYYFVEPDIGRSAARIVNDGISEAVGRHPDRLIGMGTVPLQNPNMAIAEMRRCVSELGMRGIEISTNVNGLELADSRFRPFFAAAEELGILIFIHPLGFTHGQRLSEHYLNNILGNPLESTIALSHLIFGGVLDQFSGLKICVAHGGGYLPGYWGRMDHAYRAREDCREHIKREPSSYLRQVWLDTLVFDKDQLDFLVRTHGPDKLCLGTDYPFDMAEPDPLGFHGHLDDSVKARILGLNALKLLGLPPSAMAD